MKEYEVVNAFFWVSLSHKPILIELKECKGHSSHQDYLLLLFVLLSFGFCHCIMSWAFLYLIASGVKWLMPWGFRSTQLFLAAFAPFAHVTPPRAPISHLIVGESSRAWQSPFREGRVPLGIPGRTGGRRAVATVYISFFYRNSLWWNSSCVILETPYK